MGRWAAAADAGGDSSPSSTESSFRELDDVYLQSRTRIWLEEVLDTRLDEDLDVSDLLQDGEILFELSKVVWDLLLKNCVELRYLKGKHGPFGSRKSSGRYRPYSNVDSFLKICKILGLKGIDLFSPSDVVENRDIRKVCICIRALSKKARSKKLTVPDFDMVMYSVSMPKDMVGCIRRCLELSQSTNSSSSSSPKNPRVKLGQKHLHTPFDKDDDSCSEESDEAESRYRGENSFPTPSNFADSRVNSVLEKDQEFDSLSSFGLSSRKNVNLKYRNCVVDIVDSNFALETDDSFVGDSSYINGEESSYIADYLAFSDLMVHTADNRNLAFLDGENNMFDFFLNPDSQGKQSSTRSPQNGKLTKFSDDEEMEVSSTTSMSSVLCRVLNLEFDEEEFDKQYQESPGVSESKKSVIFEVPAEVGLDYSIEAQSETALSAKKIRSSQSICQEVESFGSISRDREATSCMENSDSGDSKVTPIDKDEDDTTVCEGKEGNYQDIPAGKCSNERLNTGLGISPSKLVRRPFLKTVFKGTAIAGVFFLLLHINGGTSRGDNALETKEYAQRQSKFSSKKQQVGSRVNGIYHSENIRLKN